MFKDFRTECETLGISIGEIKRNKHPKVSLTNRFGLHLNLTVPNTPSDRRAWLNCRAMLRRFSRSQP